MTYQRIAKDIAMLSLVAALALVPAKSRTVDQAETSAIGRPPAGLSVSDWNAILAAYEQNRNAVFAVPGGYQARNDAQDWLVNFDGRGFEVTPDRAQWRWGLELESFGRTRREHMPTHTGMLADKERLTYAWGRGLRSGG